MKLTFKLVWLVLPLTLFLAACPLDAPNAKQSVVTMPETENRALIKLNEIDANGTDPNPDFIELINTHSAPITLAEGKWFLTDDDADNPKPFTIPQTTIPAGGLVSFAKGTVPSGFEFGVGKTDTITLNYKKADGSIEKIDEFTLGGSTTNSYGRLPDGTGSWVECIASKGAANQKKPLDPKSYIIINELDADGYPQDWIELMNIGTEQITLEAGKWFLTDDNSKPEYFAIPAQTIAPGAYVVFEKGTTSGTFGFGLGKEETLKLNFKNDDNTYSLVDSCTYKLGAAPHSYGRVPDGGVEWKLCTPTKGAANLAQQ